MNNYFQGYADDDDEDDPALIEAHERRIVRCKTCRAKIIWFETPAGKQMPVDADTVEVADMRLYVLRHVMHVCQKPDKRKTLRVKK